MSKGCIVTKDCLRDMENDEMINVLKVDDVKRGPFTRKYAITWEIKEEKR